MTHSQKVKRYNENENEIVLPPKKAKKTMNEDSERFADLSDSEESNPKPWSHVYADMVKEKLDENVHEKGISSVNLVELTELAELRRQNESLRAECESLKTGVIPLQMTIRHTSSLTTIPKNAEIAVIVSDEPIANVVLEHIATRLISDDSASVEFVLNRVGSTYYACQKQSALIVDKIRHVVVTIIHKKITSFRRAIPNAGDAKSDFEQTRALVDSRSPETVIDYLCARFSAVNTIVDWVGYEDFMEVMCAPNKGIPRSTSDRFNTVSEADVNITTAFAVKALRLARDIYHGYHIDRTETDSSGGFSVNNNDAKTLSYGVFTMDKDINFTFTNGIPTDFITLLSNYYQTNNARKSSRRTSKNE